MPGVDGCPSAVGFTAVAALCGSAAELQMVLESLPLDFMLPVRHADLPVVAPGT